MRKIFKWIGNAVKTVKEYIFNGNIDEKLIKVVGIVNVIKQFAESPIALIIVKATPFDWDDKLRAFLITLLKDVKLKHGSLRTAPALQEIAGTLAQKETGLPLETASFKVEETYQTSKLGV